jgi:hypothetical protein
MKSLARWVLLFIVTLGLCASVPAAEPTAKKTESCGSACCGTKAAKAKTAKKSGKCKKCAADAKTA